ncbi:MAG: hypothetical protein ACI9MR_002585 [Myxococcota bacterium]|jgi:hypothetical protein
MTLLPMLVTALTLASGPAPAGICVVIAAESSAGLSAQEIEQAWLLRRQKDALNAELQTVAQTSECGPTTTLVAKVDASAAATLTPSATGPESGWRVNLASVTPDSRAHALAIGIVSAVSALTDLTDTVPLPPFGPDHFAPASPEIGPKAAVTVAPESAASAHLNSTTAPPGPWRWGLSAGAQLWTGTSTQAPRFGSDLAVTLADRTGGLTFGLRGGWLPSASLTGTLPATQWTAYAEGLAGWRFVAVPALELRLLGGVGAEWRGLTAYPETRLDAVEVSSVELALSAEAAMVWWATPALGLELSAGGRAYPAGTARTFLGEAVNERSSLAGVLILGLAWRFN